MRARRGFTLLEIVVSLAVLALIGTLTFGSVVSSINARDILERDDTQNRSARIALAKLKRDLSLAWLTPNIQAVNTFRTIFTAADNDPDRLWFATLSHQRLYANARESDQTEVTYWTERDPTHDDAFVLMRREAPRIDSDPERGGAPLPLAYNVRSFNLEFLDSNTSEWKKEWDTAKSETNNRLPRAVRVVLEVMGPSHEDPKKEISRTYLTTVVCQYASPLKPDATGNGGAL